MSRKKMTNEEYKAAYDEWTRNAHPLLRTLLYGIATKNSEGYSDYDGIMNSLEYLVNYEYYEINQALMQADTIKRSIKTLLEAVNEQES